MLVSITQTGELAVYVADDPARLIALGSVPLGWRGAADEARRCLEAGVVLPAYECALKCSHLFNVLDARGALSVTERATSIQRIRRLGQPREIHIRVACPPIVSGPAMALLLRLDAPLMLVSVVVASLLAPFTVVLVAALLGSSAGAGCSR